MANATITNAEQGTYDLWNNDQIVRAVLNGAQWGNFQQSSKFYALMMALGSYNFTGNTKIDIVKGAGVPSKFTTAADIDTGTDTTVTFANLTGANAGDIVPGDLIMFDGEDGVLRVDSVTTTTITFSVITTNTTGATTADTIDSGTLGFWLSADEYDGEAPTPVNYTPDFLQNYMQMFRRSWVKGYVAGSQNTIFDNGIEYLGQLMTTKMFKEINFGLLYSAAGQAVGSSADYGITAGLPYFLDLANAGTFTDERDQAVTYVDPGTAFTDFGLEAWSNKMTEGSPLKLAVMSQTCLTALNQAMVNTGSTTVFRKDNLGLPGFNRDGWIMDLGDYQYQVVVDRSMDTFSHVFKGTRVSAADATERTAAKGYYFLAVDPANAKIAYHDNNELGIMAPRVHDVSTTNNRHANVKEVKTALTFGVQNFPSHGAYGINGA